MADIIFDFDGTLADTFPLIVDVSYRLGRADRLSEKEIAKLRKLPLLTAVQNLGIARWKLPWVVALSRSLMTSEMRLVEPYPGVLPLLKDLHKRHRLFILTSNYKRNVRAFLHHNQSEDLFTKILTVPYASTRTKSWALRYLMKRYGLRKEETYHVGNEALDTHAANTLGIRGIATTWGGFDLAALKEAHPYAIIDRPGDLPGLVQ